MEPNSEVVRELWTVASSRAASRLLVVEVRSALGRAYRDGRISARQRSIAREESTALLAAIDFVEPTPELLSDAADLAEAHGLRAYDAVHLASALALRGLETVLATWDGELRRAARAEGLAVVA